MKWFVPAYAVLAIIRTYLKYYTKAREKNLVFSIDNIGYAFLVAILNILFLVKFDLNVKGYLLSYIIAEALSCAFLFVLNDSIKSVVDVKLDKDIIRKMIIYSAPLVLNSISWGVASSSDRIMIGVMVSSGAVGIYTAASKIPTIVNTVVNFFCQAWTISSFLEIDNKDQNFYSHIYRIYSFILLLCVAFVLFILRPFNYIYVDHSYLASSNYAPILLIASVYQNYAAFFGSIIQSGKKNTLMLISTLSAACINIILNYVLIGVLGIMGGSIATVISFLIVFVLRLLFSRRVISFPLNAIKLVISNFLIIVQAILVSYNQCIIVSSVISISLIILLNIDIIKFVLSRLFLK